jgi:hypothetical protein
MKDLSLHIENGCLRCFCKDTYRVAVNYCVLRP